MYSRIAMLQEMSARVDAGEDIKDDAVMDDIAANHGMSRVSSEPHKSVTNGLEPVVEGDSHFLWHSEVKNDPEIAMRTITVKFADSKFNYQTEINGTRESIGNYFRGARLNVANFPDEQMEVPVCIWFMADDEYATVAMDLNESEECKHTNAFISDDEEPPTWHCPDCSSNVVESEIG